MYSTVCTEIVEEITYTRKQRKEDSEKIEKAITVQWVKPNGFMIKRNWQSVKEQGSKPRRQEEQRMVPKIVWAVGVFLRESCGKASVALMISLALPDSGAKARLKTQDWIQSCHTTLLPFFKQSPTPTLPVCGCAKQFLFRFPGFLHFSRDGIW